MTEKHLTDGTTALAAQPRVIKIDAEKLQNAQLRVAAYTRVSSDSDDQMNSFTAQNRYYTELISDKAEWRIADIYADKGINGTSVKNHEDFMRMIRHCRQRKIDVVLTKSVSSFARNTVDCLYYARVLKELVSPSSLKRSIFRTAETLDNKGFLPFSYARLSLICRLNL